MIDEVPALAVVASLARGTTVFAGVGELRVKETDRIAEMEAILARFGVRTESGPEQLVVHGGGVRRPEVALAPSADHRLAMASVALGLAVSARDGAGPVDVCLDAVGVSDPGFAAGIEQLQRRGD